MIFEFIPKAEAITAVQFVKNVNKVIVDPILTLLFAVAFVYFLWGVAQYLMSGDNEEIRSASKKHMIWGVIGLFVMISVFGIINLIINTVNS